MPKKLSDCLNTITSIDNADVFVFEPQLGCFNIEYIENAIDYNYRLTIPYEEKQISLLLDEDRLKKFSTLVGIGSKHFDILVQSKEKIISNLKEMLDVSEQEFYFLASGVSHAVSDVSMNTVPVKIGELFENIKKWYLIGSNESDPFNPKEWTEESLNENLQLYYFSNLNGVTSVAFGLKYKETGCFLKCNRLGSVKTTMYPCWFKKLNEKDDYIPVIFDINGITESKPAFKPNLDLETNISTIMTEADDFLYDIRRKINFELEMSIDSEQYLKHLSSETKIPKKYIKKGIIAGETIKTIVASICSECYNLIHAEENETIDENAVIKNHVIFEKLCKAAGYALFYQDRFCNCCYKTTTLSED